jgi:hypothetical protein
MDERFDNNAMSQFEQEAHSFVIRIWKEHGDESSQTTVWRGRMRHAQSNKQHYFSDVAAIGPIIARYLEPHTELDDIFETIAGKKHFDCPGK